MFERFTDRARRVVVWAQEEARGFDHNYIGTEHLLLGLLREEEGVAAKALSGAGIDVDLVREEVNTRIGRGSEAPKGHIPFTPRAKKVLELSLRQALKLDHNYIGTEHILLGLVEEGEGVAAQILLTRVDGGLEAVRQAVVNELDLPPQVRQRVMEHVFSAAQGRHAQRDILVRLEAIEARLSAIESLLRGQPSGQEEVS